MYFPYLRGKQFEIIALRELMEKGLLSEKVVPILEPIKLTTTLKKTIELYCNEEARIALVCNPQVGSLIDKGEEILDYFQKYFINESLIPAYILSSDISDDIKRATNIGLRKEDMIMVHMDRDKYQSYTVEFNDKRPMYNLIPEGSYKRKVKDNKVIFADRYEKQGRNADYADCTDEYFSDDHLEYLVEGYEGFADYTITGEEYSDSGFLPRAVAIHITYFDEEENLRIRHFVSDSNSDTADPANKFYEALRKLIKWYKKIETKNKSHALEIFKEHYERGSYPGLGTVKKLSIMHHLEIMSNYLDR